MCAEMLGSCVGVAVLAILFEGLKVLREYIDMKARRGVYAISCGHVQESSDSGSKSMSTSNSKADFHEERTRAKYRRKQYV